MFPFSVQFFFPNAKIHCLLSNPMKQRHAKHTGIILLLVWATIT